MQSHHVLMYRCDHCHKSMRNKKKAIQHEQGCMRNPQRVCGMCEREGRAQIPTGELVAFLTDGGGDIESLREKTGGCPMCMLAACYQANEATGIYHVRHEEAWWFDYKAELERHDQEREKKAIAAGDVIF